MRIVATADINMRNIKTVQQKAKLANFVTEKFFSKVCKRKMNRMKNINRIYEDSDNESHSLGNMKCNKFDS